MANDAALMEATSAGIGRDGSTYVLLRWEAVDDVTGYNLYRRVDGAPARESRPINGSSPIRPPSSARQLRAIVPEGSPEWAALVAGFTAVSGGALERVNPAARFEQGLTEDELRLVRATSRANLAMAQAAGVAYTDRGAQANKHYLYELRGVLADGTERRLAVDVPVWAGHFTLPDPPSGVTTQPGDRRVLVLWNRNPYAATFVVQRATSPGGPFQQVNPKPVA